MRGTYERELSYARQNGQSETLTGRQRRRSDKKARSRIAAYRRSSAAQGLDFAETVAANQENDRERLRGRVELYPGTAAAMGRGANPAPVILDEVARWSQAGGVRVIDDVRAAKAKAWSQGEGVL